MNRSITGVLASAAIVAGGFAISHGVHKEPPKFAEVIDVAPVMRTVETPRQVCGEQSMTPLNRLSDVHRDRANSSTYTAQHHCETVVDSQERRVAYDVTYRLGDVQDMVRMEQRPGTQIPVHKGQLMLGKAALADNG